MAAVRSSVRTDSLLEFVDWRDLVFPAIVDMTNNLSTK